MTQISSRQEPMLLDRANNLIVQHLRPLENQLVQQEAIIRDLDHAHGRANEQGPRRGGVGVRPPHPTQPEYATGSQQSRRGPSPLTARAGTGATLSAGWRRPFSAWASPPLSTPGALVASPTQQKSVRTRPPRRPKTRPPRFMRRNKKEEHGRSRKPTVSTRDRPAASRIAFYFSPLVVDSVARNNDLMNVAPMELATVDRVEGSTRAEPKSDHLQPHRVTTPDATRSTQGIPTAARPAKPMTTNHWRPAPQASAPPRHRERNRKQPHPTRRDLYWELIPTTDPQNPRLPTDTPQPEEPHIPHSGRASQTPPTPPCSSH